MLEQVLRHLNNWFLAPGGIHEDTYTIQDGGVALPFLKNGQYFRICGSVFNEGLHQYPAYALTDETFAGAVWSLAVPKAVVELAGEIAEWERRMGRRQKVRTSRRVSEGTAIQSQPPCPARPAE